MSEQYQIQITARAARDLQLLPEKIATACVAFIFGPLVENPHRGLAKPSVANWPACTLPAAGTTGPSTPSTGAGAEPRSCTDRRTDVYR